MPRGVESDHRLAGIIHHFRTDSGAIETRILHEGRLRLDPPGLEVVIADILATL
jgi:hypothetical protein